MTRPAAIAYLQSTLTETSGLDRLHLTQAPLVPEVNLHLAEDAIVFWARMEAALGRTLPAPYWATAWPGGQALARYLLDHPAEVAGRRVLDLASGSGLVAIAAALAGASAVIANDIDPYALAAITLNAKANNVDLSTWPGDVLDGDGGDANLVVVGDAFYNHALADRIWPFLRRAAARDAAILLGDPGRKHLPQNQLTIMATYPAPAGISMEPEITRISVLRPRRPGPAA